MIAASGGDVFLGAFPFGFIILIFVLQVPMLVVWVIALVEVIKIPDGQFRAAGTEKVTWVIVVALLHFIGAIVWYAAKRKDVLAAPALAFVPPGWYVEPDGASVRWWDGAQWTAHRNPVSPPSGAA
jgi:hypothetical protein